MELYSWNINGYYTCDRYGGFTKILQNSPDFICCQEVKISNIHTMEDLFASNYYIYHNSSKSKGYNGVSVYSKNKPMKCEYSIGYEKFDAEGRFVCLEFEEFFLINAYMPHGGRDKRNIEYKISAYRALKSYIEKIEKVEKVILMVGDFNVAYSDNDLARYSANRNNIMFTEEEKKVFGELLSLGFIDVYRTLKPQGKEYTWWPYAFNARNRNIGWRIDYILVKGSSIKILDLEICANILGSDHCPLRLIFKL